MPPTFLLQCSIWLRPPSRTNKSSASLRFRQRLDGKAHAQQSARQEAELLEACKHNRILTLRAIWPSKRKPLPGGGRGFVPFRYATAVPGPEQHNISIDRGLPRLFASLTSSSLTPSFSCCAFSSPSSEQEPIVALPVSPELPEQMPAWTEIWRSPWLPTVSKAFSYPEVPPSKLGLADSS
jgi:hypothetical protein